MRVKSGTKTGLIAVTLALTSLAEAFANPLQGTWRRTASITNGPAREANQVIKESWENLKKAEYSRVEFSEEQILLDGKELCLGKSEVFQEKEFLRYDKSLVEKSQWHRARMDPKYDLGAVLQVCKRKGKRVDPQEFFFLQEWTARCASKQRDDLPLFLAGYFIIDENTLLAQGTLNDCLRRLRSLDDTGNYFVLEALRSYSPNKSEPASEDFLNPVKVQIPKNIAVTRGNPGNFVAKLDFKNGLGVVTSCSYKGNVTKKNPKPPQLAYEFQACDLDKKALDTLSVVSVKLRIVNSDKSAGVTAAETTFDYEP